MQVVVELDAARISRSFAQSRKLRMILAETTNRVSYMQTVLAGMQVRMALRANRIGRGSEL